MQAARVWNSVVRKTITTTTRRNYQKGTFDHIKVSLNQMPVPEGDFMMLHHARNRKYNTVLAAGILSVGFGLFLLRTTGIVHFNFSPPETYE
ncbi:CLUMA_CG016309, isoform A [Clunio marinus]|uniref:CLUMA_CG016309, isoform A n=1 Tax=Clunio marinus TaxID=568069 RepID=A0A1J1ITB8_9DIPT|nr:CLUMA_CG016309, isoform A [Clunio marinus]